jgi:Permuted papain-like amidase enzyme, YaeF/YiiX, C92 family
MGTLELERLRAGVFCSTEPFVRWLATARVAAPSGFADDAEHQRLARHLAPGMVVVSRSRLHLGNLFLPGFWKHAAICVDTPGASGKHRAPRIIDATAHRGVAEVSLERFLSDKHHVAVLRPRIVRCDRIYEVAEEARKRLGALYDFSFAAQPNGRYYCTKLVVDCLRAAMGRSPFPNRRHWGGEGITANDLYEQRDAFEVVFEAGDHARSGRGATVPPLPLPEADVATGTRFARSPDRLRLPRRSPLRESPAPLAAL